MGVQCEGDFSESVILFLGGGGPCRFRGENRAEVGSTTDFNVEPRISSEPMRSMPQPAKPAQVCDLLRLTFCCASEIDIETKEINRTKKVVVVLMVCLLARKLFASVVTADAEPGNHNKQLLFSSSSFGIAAVYLRAH